MLNILLRNLEEVPTLGLSLGDRKPNVILDDEMDCNITVEAVLQDNGFKVDSYEDHILALENFKSYFYDLVILDIKVPQMDGFVVYNEIKKLDNRILTAGEIYYGIYTDLFSSDVLFESLSKMKN